MLFLYLKGMRNAAVEDWKNFWQSTGRNWQQIWCFSAMVQRILVDFLSLLWGQREICLFILQLKRWIGMFMPVMLRYCHQLRGSWWRYWESADQKIRFWYLVLRKEYYLLQKKKLRSWINCRSQRTVWIQSMRQSRLIMARTFIRDF